VGDTSQNDVASQGSNPDFTTTHWSLVLTVADTAPARAFAALEKLCARYWFPVYAFIRRNGYDAHQAEDLAQGFFLFVVERQVLHRAAQERGRFRNFILASLRNFLHNHHDRTTAVKRGGTQVVFSMDDEKHSEEIFSQEPQHFGTADQLFERGWAAAVTRRVLESLRLEYSERGRLAVFEALLPHLTGDPPPGAYAQIGEKLDLQPGALKVAQHRLRRRFGELLRKEIAHTVARPEDVEDEIRHLLAVLALDSNAPPRQ
jgi:RNA polymerase sigma-70 factor (ECF subfamily)